MIVIVKCLRCGHQLVITTGDGGLKAEVCSICGAPGSELELVGNLEEMMPDKKLVTEMIRKVA